MWYAIRGTTTRSGAWVSVSALTNHMVQRGVWSAISKDTATAGDIVNLGGHVIVLTRSDSHNVKIFTAHTHDRKSVRIDLNGFPNSTAYRINF